MLSKAMFCRSVKLKLSTLEEPDKFVVGGIWIIVKQQERERETGDEIGEEKYCNNRGLSYDPIESIVKGAICYDEKSFLENLEKVFKGNKAFKHSIADKLFNKHFDKLSSERITKELRKILS